MTKRQIIDRHVGKLIGEFEVLLSCAKRGESVDALRLQRGFRLVSDHAWSLARQEAERATTKAARIAMAKRKKP